MLPWKEVLRAEQDLYRAMVAHDRTALRQMLAPDVVYVHSTAVAESRDEYLAGVAAGLYEYESVTSRGTACRGSTARPRSSTASATCGSARRAAAATLIHLLFVLVWVRSGGAWRLVHRHAVRIAG